MAETRNEGAQDAADLAAAARDRGMEQLEGAKGHLAEGAERVAAAVERTADELEGEGGDAISGFGHSVASLMRQLAGGLRERDVEAFARELGALARRNPGVFLAGSVALGFGIARFFKARVPRGRQGSDEPERGERDEQDSEESLDLSAGSTRRGYEGGPPGTASESSSASESGSSPRGSSATQQAASRDDDRNQSKARQSSKHKVKPQRASSGGTQRTGEESHASSTERPPTDPAPTGETAGSSDGPFTGGTGGGAPRGGKS